MDNQQVGGLCPILKPVRHVSGGVAISRPGDLILAGRAALMEPVLRDTKDGELVMQADRLAEILKGLVDEPRLRQKGHIVIKPSFDF